MDGLDDYATEYAKEIDASVEYCIELLPRDDSELASISFGETKAVVPDDVVCMRVAVAPIDWYWCRFSDSPTRPTLEASSDR
jgi:hypothetical protein